MLLYRTQSKTVLNSEERDGDGINRLLICSDIVIDVILCQTRDWEVLDDLQQTTMSVAAGSSLDLSIPGICEGYLMKGRKYPLKGWHKVTGRTSYCLLLTGPHCSSSCDVDQPVCTLW